MLVTGHAIGMAGNQDLREQLRISSDLTPAAGRAGAASPNALSRAHCPRRGEAGIMNRAMTPCHRPHSIGSPSIILDSFPSVLMLQYPREVARVLELEYRVDGRQFGPKHEMVVSTLCLPFRCGALKWAEIGELEQRHFVAESYSKRLIKLNLAASCSGAFESPASTSSATPAIPKRVPGGSRA